MWNYSRNSLKFCFLLGLITILRNIFSLISIAGCPEAAIKNIYNAVKCGVTHGCTGIVACDWSGKAHLNSHVFSWPAYMLTLGLSWNSNCHQVWQTFHKLFLLMMNEYTAMNNHTISIIIIIPHATSCWGYNVFNPSISQLHVVSKSVSLIFCQLHINF